MVLEWLRRRDATFDEHLRTYLFTDVPITEAEEAATSGTDTTAPEHAQASPSAASADAAAPSVTPPQRGLTLGSLKQPDREVA
jgi:hypothetical protein